MLTKPFKPLALAFLVNLIISVEDKIKYKVYMSKKKKKYILHIIGSIFDSMIARAEPAI